MKEVVRYQTIDGREFASKKAAQEHIEDEICRIVDPLAHKLVHANNPTNWKNGVNEIRERLEGVKTRSCWDRGVKGFALNLLRSYIDIFG